MLRVPTHVGILVLLCAVSALAAAKWPRPSPPGWAVNTCPSGYLVAGDVERIYWCTTGPDLCDPADPLKSKYHIYGIKAYYSQGSTQCYKCDWWRCDQECCATEGSKPEICGQTPSDP